MRKTINHVISPIYLTRIIRLSIVTIILAAIPVTILLNSQLQDTRQRAAEIAGIQRLAFQPSGVYTTPNKEVYLSVLAYDINNQPIFSGVTYEWGISSSNSIGTLAQIQGNITTFTPKDIGNGDIYVIAKTSTQEYVSSIPVSVSTTGTTPTPTPNGCLGGPVGCPTPTPPKVGDLNGDGKIDIFDLSTLLTAWKTNDSAADFNHDGIVDIFDLSTLLTNWTG